MSYTDLLKELPPLPFFSFFSIGATIPYSKSSGLKMKKSPLPSLLGLSEENRFAEVSLGWNEEGIGVDIDVNQPFGQVHYPLFTKGDAVELFLDTRDLKTSGIPTKFCHHFLFLPQMVQGVQCQEMTRFRTEDKHPLCSPDDLLLSSHFTKHSYSLSLWIPAHCLYGYEPQTFDRLGVAYCIHRNGGQPQCFGLSYQYFNLSQHPRLWASVTLRRP